MGIICELYRLSDSEIEELKKLNIDDAEEYLDEKFAWVDSVYHKQNDTVFSMDKGWGITRFLIQEYDKSPNKILAKLNERFVKSNDVKLINKELESIEIEDLKNIYNQEKLIENHVYHANYEVHWEYINNYHLKLYKSGFKKASELNSGIAITYG
ncbi:DUF1877 family protein [uncultured Psychroserpens sp.]|uniref:DUF1877 family protein n=1 Tax=uncultured Psychroserpens sp. TaxID=255436 RepID=UPI00262D1FE5|nr:DUF1877 family protein [uncultured Psychroserpens sp.]